MGKIKKGELCSIEGCDEVAVRSVSLSLTDAGEKSPSVRERMNARKLYMLLVHFFVGDASGRVPRKGFRLEFPTL
ncbi:MAG: hypothetical protein ACTSYT_04270 [Candidatus Asgardarchaeia archaeon]